MTTTFKDAQTAFGFYLKVIGKRLAKPYDPENGFDVGGYQLDYSPTYGGVIIVEYINPQGGETHPIISERMPLKQFVQTLWFAEKSIKAMETTNELPKGT